jgi:hypothetical protein
MINEITNHQEREWKQIVLKSLDYDSYHTWQYHNLSKDGTPVLLVYNEGDNFIALPLLKRNIPNTNLFDMTSVYGYTGPLSNLSFSEIPLQMKENFKRELNLFFRANNIVSVFSRLNPFLSQMPLMGTFQGVHDNGNGVVIDLNLSLEAQRSKYKSTLLKQILKMQKLGFSIKDSKNSEAIKEFAEIYTENMKRVGATDFYMFTEEYFKNFLNSSDFHSKLIMIYYEGIAVCGGIVIFTQKIIHSHLSATRTSYLKYSPSKLLLDEISQLGRQLGMQYFNLGGGLGFNKDSLFDFKSSFSDNYYDYKTWRYISDPENYLRLITEANIDPDNAVDFFPLYRYSNTKNKDVEVKILTNSCS